MNMWWTHWIYRCPKISLKDIMQLEPYSRDLELWRDYYRDGQDLVTAVELNSEYLPGAIRHLVRLNTPKVPLSNVRNIMGIGSMTAFRDAHA